MFSSSITAGVQKSDKNRVRTSTRVVSLVTDIHVRHSSSVRRYCNTWPSGHRGPSFHHILCQGIFTSTLFISAPFCTILNHTLISDDRPRPRKLSAIFTSNTDQQVSDERTPDADQFYVPVPRHQWLGPA